MPWAPTNTAGLPSAMTGRPVAGSSLLLAVDLNPAAWAQPLPFEPSDGDAFDELPLSQEKDEDHR